MKILRENNNATEHQLSSIVPLPLRCDMNVNKLYLGLHLCDDKMNLCKCFPNQYEL